MLFLLFFSDTILSADLVTFLWTIFMMPFNIVSDQPTVFRHIGTDTNLTAGMMNEVVSIAVLRTHAYVYL